MTQQVGAEAGLTVRGLSKAFKGSHGRTVFSDLSFDLARDGRLAVLGRNGQGKSTLIKILGGVLPQTEGNVEWRMIPSWPIGFGGGFQGSLTGIDNIRFVTRVYGRDYDEVFDRVEGFAELGAAMRQPIKHYSSGMRARLAFGLSLAIEFDCYLIDELVSVGDARFQRKCQEELFERRADRAFMLASHDMNIIASTCSRAIVVEGGRAKLFEDIEEGIDVYTWLRAA